MNLIRTKRLKKNYSNNPCLAVLIAKEQRHRRMEENLPRQLQVQLLTVARRRVQVKAGVLMKCNSTITCRKRPDSTRRIFPNSFLSRKFATSIIDSVSLQVNLFCSSAIQRENQRAATRNYVCCVWIVLDCGYVNSIDSFCSEFKGVPDYEDYISDDEDDRNPMHARIADWKVSCFVSYSFGYEFTNMSKFKLEKICTASCISSERIRKGWWGHRKIKSEQRRRYLRRSWRCRWEYFYRITVCLIILSHLLIN